MRAILTYHSIDNSGSVISVSPAAFAEQVRWLASGAVAVLPVAELLAVAPGQAAVAITFDDGFMNFGTEAWPLLRDSGLPATLFIATHHAGRTNRWTAEGAATVPTFPLLDWDALGHLAEQGVSLGGHTRTHPDLRLLNDSMISDEIAGSIEDIVRRTGARADGFAYPYGRCDERVVGVARASCAWACTTVLRPVATTDDSHRLPRLDAYFLRGPARLEAYGSLVFRSYLSGRAILRRFAGR